jgi:hypothetical protein
VATTTDELLDFVKQALARGTSRADIEQVLLRTGWSRDQVAGAMGSYAEVEFPIPVPRPKPYLSAREAFTYLLLFTTLYISAFNVGALVFYFINDAFPDPAVQANSSYARDGLRWSLASLIVAFPVFAFLTSLVERSVRADPAKRRSNVRRWLMYLTVFAAAAVLIGDFITLVHSALGGELQPRFVLKVLTIAAIGGAVFVYYLSDLRLEDSTAVTEEPRWRRLVARGALVFVGLAAAGGFFGVGAPSDERARRLDTRRVADLRGISEAANVFLDRHGRLPGSLDELAREPGVSLNLRDPGSTAYEYRVTGGRSYEVCATFQRDSAESGRPGADFWSHGAGRQCFRIERKASD